VPILHDIDATKLPTYKTLRHVNEDGDTEPWDTIAFQFPHTGGLSTDVNRQVRANQALLVGFFGSCLEVKAEKKDAQPARKKAKGLPFLRPGGKVIVTLFEGAPYSLWNVRDLARHAGLKVVESFKFSFKDYPGYSHVRTLGTIEGGGGWKGEEREARMYIFEKVETKGDAGGQGNVGESGRDARGMKMDPGRRKRRDGDGLKRGRESDEDEDDD
jgi:25S rRNA (uracil2634-N3)-methyltransferase